MFRNAGIGILMVALGGVVTPRGRHAAPCGSVPVDQGAPAQVEESEEGESATRPFDRYLRSVQLARIGDLEALVEAVRDYRAAVPGLPGQVGGGRLEGPGAWAPLGAQIVLCRQLYARHRLLQAIVEYNRLLAAPIRPSRSDEQEADAWEFIREDAAWELAGCYAECRQWDDVKDVFLASPSPFREPEAPGPRTATSCWFFLERLVQPEHRKAVVGLREQLRSYGRPSLVALVDTAVALAGKDFSVEFPRAAPMILVWGRDRTAVRGVVDAYRMILRACELPLVAVAVQDSGAAGNETLWQAAPPEDPRIVAPPEGAREIRVHWLESPRLAGLLNEVIDASFSALILQLDEGAKPGGILGWWRGK